MERKKVQKEEETGDKGSTLAQSAGREEQSPVVQSGKVHWRLAGV